MSVKPIGYSIYPNIMFTIEDGNSDKYFDIVSQENSDQKGKSSCDCKTFRKFRSKKILIIYLVHCTSKDQ